MTIWTFRTYIGPSGRNYVRIWYDSLDIQAQAAFDAIREFLAQRQRSEWRRPDFDILAGGIGEFRFQASKVQHRPLGFFGPGRLEYTFLIGATKKGKKYNPQDARNTAEQRKIQLQNGEGRANVWEG